MTLTAPVPAEETGDTIIGSPARKPRIDIALPVHNSATELEAFLRRTSNYFTDFEVPVTLTVIDCASTDRTLAIAEKVSREISTVRVLHLETNSTAEALRLAWESSTAHILVHTIVSTHYTGKTLEALVTPLLSGTAEIAVGVTHGADEYTEHGFTGAFWRGLRNTALRTFTGDRHLRARSGLLALRANFARALLPFTGDSGEFLDTELLILAQRSGLDIAEVPVHLSSLDYVDVEASAFGDIRGAVALRRRMRREKVKLPLLREASSRIGLSGEAAAVPLVSVAMVGILAATAGLFLLLV